MNAPTLNHRSSSNGVPESFGDIADTIALATERISAIGMLVDQQLESPTLSNATIGVCVDVMRQEAGDIDVWLRWWLEQESRSKPRSRVAK